MKRREQMGDQAWTAADGPNTGHSAAHHSRGAQVSPLEELMRRKGVDEAWNALEEMQQQGLFVDRFTVSRMLMKTVAEGRGRSNPAKIYRAIALVDRFIQLQPREADEVLFNALLDTCCRMKDIKRVESAVDKMTELQIYPSHVTLGILVKAYGQAGDAPRVLKVWDSMDEQRRQANAVTYGCMIDACVKCGYVQKAVEIFGDMKRKKKHRNTILYTTLIKGYGMEKDLRNALALFKEMKTEGVPYNTITYNSIIDVCIKCSDMQVAEDLMQEMIETTGEVEPDLITYSTLLKGYCHNGDLDKALQVAETIKACGLKCDELVYNTLMDGCVKANDLSAGIGLFAEMTTVGMRPSSITHSILLRLYQRNGYKGDAGDAVAQLYQHHGLERHSVTNERGGGARGSGGSGGSGRGKQRAPGADNYTLRAGRHPAMPFHNMRCGSQAQSPPYSSPAGWLPGAPPSHFGGDAGSRQAPGYFAEYAQGPSSMWPEQMAPPPGVWSTHLDVPYQQLALQSHLAAARGPEGFTDRLSAKGNPLVGVQCGGPTYCEEY